MDQLLYPVQILEDGIWDPKDILIFERQRSPLPTDIAMKIEHRWQMAEKDARQEGCKLTRGGVRAGKSLYSKGQSICLKYVNSDYGNVIGSTHQDVPEEYQDRFVGFMCVTQTSDGYIVYGVRGAIDWPYQCHIAPAGRWSLKQASPVAGMVAEFEKELGILPYEIEGLCFIGVVADETQGRKNFEFIFTAQVPLTFAELRKRAFGTKSGSEHVQLLPVRGQDIKNLITSAPFKWVPTGFAAMALWYNGRCIARKKIAWDVDENMTYDAYMEKSRGQ